MSQFEQAPIWEINNLEFEADFFDIDFLKKYQDAMELMPEEEAKVSKDGSGHERLSEICDIYYRFFDRVFGKGTSTKIFGNKRNLRNCEIALISIIELSQKCNIEQQTRRENFIKPKNRAQRRASNTVNKNN